MSKTRRDFATQISELQRETAHFRLLLETQPSQHASPGLPTSAVFPVLLRNVTIADEEADPVVLNSATAHRLRWKNNDPAGLVQPEAFGALLTVFPTPGFVWENLTWPGLAFELSGPLVDEVLSSGRIYPMMAFNDGGKILIFHSLKIPPARAAVEMGIIQSEG